jgi:thiosulfate/3-mercaptopyruvate sulfurtransferase
MRSLPFAEPKMKHLLFAIAGLAVSASIHAAPPLLSPPELQSMLSQPDVRIVDIRDPGSYGASHIPGAVNAPYGRWRGPTANPGELPPLPKLTALVQSLGLTAGTHAVIVSSGADATDFGASARVYWTLKVLGLQKLSVLNGGVLAWSQASLPLANTPVTVAASDYRPQLDTSQLATKEDVLARVKSGESRLIDARPEAFYNGETRAPAAKLPGTLKGAVNLRHDKWFVPGTATFVPVEQARRIAASSPIDPAKETISFCNTGHWAATNWFAMSEVLGQQNVKLYAGSMVEWSQHPDLPMVNVPNRLQQLLIDTRIWANRTFK